MDSGDDASTIYANDILEVVTVSGNSKPNNLGVDQRCLVVKNQLGEKLQLPLNTPGKFSSQLDVKWYSMAEIVTQFGFPVRTHLVSAHPGHRVHGHNKFVLLSTEVETSVLATVNKELIAIPIAADIEVSFHSEEAGLVVDLTSPSDSEVASTVPNVVINDTGATPEAAAKPNEVSISDTNPFKNAFPEVPTLADSLWGFEDNFSPTASPRSSLLSLSESDRIKVRTGSVRRFGSTVSLVERNDITETHRPERIFEMFEQLQNRTAECIRLREDSNKLQARCQRIELQAHQSKRRMTECERSATFWRDRLEQTHTIDQVMLDQLEQYCHDPTTSLPQPQAKFGKVPPPVAQKTKKAAVLPQVSADPPKPVSISAESLSTDRLVQLLKALNMAQYCTSFEQEQVDGGLLLELDEESLESDLGIKSALHRKKLLRTIHGKGTPLNELLK